MIKLNNTDINNILLLIDNSLELLEKGNKEDIKLNLDKIKYIINPMINEIAYLKRKAYLNYSTKKKQLVSCYSLELKNEVDLLLKVYLNLKEIHKNLLETKE